MTCSQYYIICNDLRPVATPVVNDLLPVAAPTVDDLCPVAIQYNSATKILIQQSNENNLEERKHILIDLNRTLAQSGPDKELTEEEFNEALRRSGKGLIRIGFDTRISRT